MKHGQAGWLMVAGLWVCLAVLFGSATPPIGLFYKPVSADFHTTRAGVSMLSTLQALGTCAGALIAGWLLNWIDAKRVMVAGAALEGASFLLSAHAPTFNTLLMYSGLVGLGEGISTLIPVSFIVGNWFGEGAGLAMGLTMTGTSLGGSLMVGVIAVSIARGGWRHAYVVIALPIFLLVIPLIMLLRSRPPQATPTAGRSRAQDPGLAGLEVHEALRTREFWLIAASQFAFGSVGAGLLNHLVPYLQSIGYGRGRAAIAMSVVLATTSLGKISLGFITDRIGARWTVVLNFVLEALGIAALIGAARVLFLACGIGGYGLTWGTPLALLPLLTMESLGLKRYGAISGLTSIGFTAGNAFGPLAAGRVFDVTGSYTWALVGMSAGAAACALAVLGCRPLSEINKSLVEPAAQTVA